jgi:hypothetical protein
MDKPPGGNDLLDEPPLGGMIWIGFFAWAALSRAASKGVAMRAPAATAVALTGSELNLDFGKVFLEVTRAFGVEPSDPI